LNLFFFLWG
jgi:hypothetical protein